MTRSAPWCWRSSGLVQRDGSYAPAAAVERTSAASRSAIRSSTDSMPTESRMRFFGLGERRSAVEACVICAGCSIRLSTPPSDSASVQIFVARDQLDRFLLGAGEERDHPAEVAHLALRDLVAGMARQPRVEHLLDAWCDSRYSAIRRAFSQWRSMRTARVFSPRSTSHESNGPGTPPSDFCRK